jgi:protein-S-isoprenylcysteine O-methyltransferase Ste14
MISLEDIMDSNAMIGMLGLVSSITLQQVSTIISIFVGIATFTYMTIRIYKELKKIKSEE